MQCLVAGRTAAELAPEHDHSIRREAHVHLARRCGERTSRDRTEAQAIGSPDRQVCRERPGLEMLALLERCPGQGIGEGCQAIGTLGHADPQAARASEVRERAAA